jgi:hypothetical protein
MGGENPIKKQGKPDIESSIQWTWKGWSGLYDSSSKLFFSRKILN